MSAIREELMKAADIKPKRGESDDDLHRRLAKAISEDIDDPTWNALSSEAQDWNNATADAITNGKPIPAFPDAAASPTATAGSDAPTGRRRGSEAGKPSVGSAEKPKAYEPKVGDSVVIKTKRGRNVEGIIVTMDADGYVLNKDGEDGKEADDMEVPLATVAGLALSNTPEAAAAGSTTQAAAGAEEPPVPEVGDTVKIETKRGKILTGNLTAIDDDGFVLKDAAGDEHELAHAQVKTFEIKVKGKAPAPASNRRKASEPPAEPASTGRRRGAAAEAKPEGERKRVSNEKGVSVSHRINEIMIDNPDITEEKLGAMLKKEGIEFRPNTLSLNHSSAKKFLDLLKSKGKFK